MHDVDQEILIIVSTGTVLLLLLAIFIFIFMMLYQKKSYEHLNEKSALKEAFAQEILKAQIEMQEQTFLTISQEIHDNIGQVLSLVRLNISTVKPNDYPATEEKLSDSKELLDQAIEDLRDLSKRLNAQFVSSRTLAELLQFQLKLIRKAGLHETTFDMHGEERPLDPGQKLIVFRIAQEALNNVLKHAAAKSISVVLMYLPDKTILSIKDDGKGFDPAELSGSGGPPQGLGTYNMHYRAGLIGARFSLQGRPGEGTLAQLILPVTP